jgi:uncharacterized membrane protein
MSFRSARQVQFFLKLDLPLWNQIMSNFQSQGLFHRLQSIDALRGLVMLIMLMDHVRETFFLHMQVADPVDVSTTTAGLFLIRLASSVCAPTFVFLAGLSIFLRVRSRSKNDTAIFALTRGILFIILELFVVGFAWSAVFPPEKYYLQIIWCMGLCMIVLAALIFLPKKIQLCTAILLVSCHHLLENVTPSDLGISREVWAILYQRDWIDIFGIPARTSYPILPWIGVMLAGYVAGHWYSSKADSLQRMRRLPLVAAALALSFLLLRGLNVYGDHPRVDYDNLLLNTLNFFALTKYPPSLLFILSTLSFTVCGLWFFERFQSKYYVHKLAVFGSGAMFFYVIHLFFLKGLYLIAEGIFGRNKGTLYGVSHLGWIMVWTIIVAVILFPVTIKFVSFKARNRHRKWLSYL